MLCFIFYKEFGTFFFFFIKDYGIIEFRKMLKYRSENFRICRSSVCTAWSVVRIIWDSKCQLVTLMDFKGMLINEGKMELCQHLAVQNQCLNSTSKTVYRIVAQYRYNRKFMAFSKLIFIRWQMKFGREWNVSEFGQISLWSIQSMF